MLWYISKNDASLWKPLPLLCHMYITATNEDPENTCADAAPEDLQAKLHSTSETYVCTNPALFARRLLICGAAALQMHIWKDVPKASVLF